MSTPSQETIYLTMQESSREDQIQAFLAWLPEPLRHAPLIDWTRLSSDVYCYLVRISPAFYAAGALAVTAFVMTGPQKPKHVYRSLGSLHTFCILLQEKEHLTELPQTSQLAFWSSFIEKVPPSPRRFELLKLYSAATNKVNHYYHQIDPADRSCLRPYIFPQLPGNFVKHYGGKAHYEELARERRKAVTDVIVPLYPLLVPLIYRRKLIAQHLYEHFQAACAQIRADTLPLPYLFEYDELPPFIPENAPSVAEAHIEGRPVTLRFQIWDQRSWMLAHRDQPRERETRRRSHRKEQIYAEQNQHFFVQFEGPTSDLLWFGDLIDQGFFRYLSHHHVSHAQTPFAARRTKRAAAQGPAQEFGGTPRGLLTAESPMGSWLNRYQYRHDLIFDPQAIYFGTLFGSALLLITLTTGCRLNELQQISADRFKVRQTSIRVSTDTSLHTEPVTLYFQHLLIKSHASQEQRELYPMSYYVMQLLEEITQLLKARHQGIIPQVRPDYFHPKYEELPAERYLFQWNASEDGRRGSFASHHIQTLLRFVLAGILLYTKHGERISVSVHVLRHVAATAARHLYNVPAEVVSRVLLHHHSRIPDTIPEVSAYYMRQTEEKSLQQYAEFQQALEVSMNHLEVVVPTKKELAEMNDDLRDVFARWQTLHPTAFGYCGCIDLCPRGYDRALCIGCRFLIPDPLRMGAAQAWRQSYAQEVERLKVVGAERDAEQQHLKVQQLDDLLSVMRTMQQGEQAGWHIPAYTYLPAPQEDSNDAEELF